MRLFLPFILQALFSIHPTSGSSISPNLILTKTYTTPSNQTYTYTFAAPTNETLPTLLLLHGYPSSRHDWTTQIRALTFAGYGVLAPDLLGFGDSSKPIAIEAYNTKTLSTHLIQLLDAEGLPSVVGVGHDWGANLLGKAAAFFPARFEKLVFVAIGYYPPGVLLDVDAINKAAVEAGEAAPLGYWYFFNSWDAARIIEGHLESFFHLLFPSNASAWANDFTDLGAARTWLNRNKSTTSPAWLSTEFKANWLREFVQPNIVPATLNYYQAAMRGASAADEAIITDADRKLKVPVLAVGAGRDMISPPEVQKATLDKWVEREGGVEQMVVDAGHWIALEKGEELASILVDFARRE